MSASGVNNKDVPDNPAGTEDPKTEPDSTFDIFNYFRGFSNSRDDPDVVGESSAMGFLRMQAIKDEEEIEEKLQEHLKQHLKEHSKEVIENPEKKQPVKKPKTKLTFQLKSGPTVELQSLQKSEELSISLDGAADSKGKPKKAITRAVSIDFGLSHNNENKATNDTSIEGQDEADNTTIASFENSSETGGPHTARHRSVSLTLPDKTEKSRTGRHRLDNPKKNLKGKERRTSADSIESAEFKLIKSRTWSVPSNSTIPAAPILTPEAVLAWPTHGLIFDDEAVDEATMRHMERWRQINRDEDISEVDEYTQRLGYGRRWSIATEGLINSREVLKEMARQKAEQEERERRAKEQREAERRARIAKWERERIERERRLKERAEREKLMRGGRGAGKVSTLDARPPFASAFLHQLHDSSNILTLCLVISPHPVSEGFNKMKQLLQEE
ncbi:hypothetical protein BZA77DRAFT_359594 [Pyronema omphalodes]|nr:hypothetical protein BZA77DRAFT_359594 [Pyronema omphalodes]